ncbi:MAG: hypothetical protein JNM56_17590 [Planctomycetia bacterium]|nr:hypothetical protein [Planctomycetia bacterium]
MRRSCRFPPGLVLLIGLLGAEAAESRAQAPVPVMPQPYVPRADGHDLHLEPVRLKPGRVERVPFDALAPEMRERVRSVAEHPTLSACGPQEEFIGRPEVYRWLLDHPDRTAQAWRQLGAPALDITERNEGRFGWTDAQGSDVVWETVHRADGARVWYAEGKVRPHLLLPVVPVKAVVVTQYREYVDRHGAKRMQHQTDLFAQTDSKAAQLIMKVMGPSVPRLTEQCLGQFGLFFSGMSNYLYRHPERTEALLR